MSLENSWEGQPAEQGENKSVTFAELISHIDEQLFEQILESDPTADEDIKEFLATTRTSYELSKQTGEFYRFLIPRSLKKPDRDYLNFDRPSRIIEDGESQLEFLDQKATELEPEDFLKTKSFWLDAYKRGIVFSSEVYEKEGETSDGIPFQIQRMAFSHPQRNSENVILETVKNICLKDRNLPSAELLIVNSVTGQRLDLAALLPMEYDFQPSELYETKETIESDDGGESKIIRQPVRHDLKEYQGSAKTKGEFYAGLGNKKISYGNLVEKGGMLSLLHEIAHAWQDVYYDNFGRGDFEVFYQSVSVFLELLAREKAKGHDEWSITYFQEKLAELGVKVDPERFIVSDKSPLTEGQKFKDKFTNQEFIINSDRLNALTKEYVREERDAWAHGLRVLRFLRKNGFDLEPELKTLDDVKELVHSCLGSYQDSLDKMIESSDRELRFAK